MLAAFLLLPIVTVFVVIDHDSTSEESTSIASGFGPEVRVENTYGSGGARNGSVSMSGSGSDLGSTVVVETDNRVGGVGKLSNGWDRCFVDEDGYHRCYPMVFFFGTSKCGEFEHNIAPLDRQMYAFHPLSRRDMIYRHMANSVFSSNMCRTLEACLQAVFSGMARRESVVVRLKASLFW